MLFPTLEFAVFFVVVFTASWLLRPAAPMGWRVFMLGASLFFYGYWDSRFIGLLLGSIVVNHLLGDLIYRSLGPDGTRTAASRNLVRLAVVLNLAVLGWFKYYGFFSVEVTNWLERAGLGVDPPLLQLILPIGISFFTFQAMSYVIDIGRTDIKPMKLLDFAVYLSFFPHLVAGPIVRASEFAPQLKVVPDPRYLPSSEAFWLIFVGLFKKVVVSSYLASAIVDPVFAVPEAHSAPEIIIAVYAYAIQIYADFSGYTDIAIGIALLLGIRFPLNFNAPYRALSVQDFWRRWHMTLSRWLRDYLYIPLGGSRGSTFNTYRNLMLTMVLGGLWHGAAWNFVIWGFIHGTALSLERAVGAYRAARNQASELPAWASSVLRWLLTFNVVCLAWVFFRSPTFGDAMTMLGQLTDWSGSAELVTPGLLLVIGLMLLSQFVPPAWVTTVQTRFSQVTWAGQGAIFGVSLVVIDVLGPSGVAPFIYFQF
jgi:alginate O-acetyltransferase complex protein AlgI